jgi:hypothetical protein
MASKDLQVLVSQLESHLNQSETTLKAQLRIDPTTPDHHLDELFLVDTFSHHSLLSNLPILRRKVGDDNDENYSLESKCLEQASHRLKQYIE